jgi:hypothetical protein
VTDERKDRRAIAIVLCLAAAAAFAYACVVQTWLYNPRNERLQEVGFGLRGMFACPYGGECRSLSNRELVDEWKRELAAIKERAASDPTNPVLEKAAAEAVDELRAPVPFPTFGWITLVCLAIAAVSLVISAALALARKRILWPIMPTTTAILGTALGLISGCVFVALKPGPPGYVGTGMGFYAFGGGVLAGIAGAILINKVLRPVDPDLLADAMSPDQY